MPSLRMIGPSGVIASAVNLTGLNSTTAVTVGFWYKGLGTGNVESDLFSHASTANAVRDGFYVHINSSAQLCFNSHSATATSTTTAPGTTPFLRSGLWAHYAITFDDSTNFVRFYVNGHLVSTGSNSTDMTANAACTTRVGINAFVSGFGLGYLFDLQLAPNWTIPPDSIGLLMNPQGTPHQGVRGRWFGVNYRSPGASGLIYDQSGNGNHLTGSSDPVQTTQNEDPPYLPTLA